MKSTNELNLQALKDLQGITQSYMELSDRARLVFNRLQEWQGQLEKKIVRSSKWSPLHDECRDCGTNSHEIYNRHYGNGYCYRCYMKLKAREYRARKKAKRTPQPHVEAPVLTVEPHKVEKSPSVPKKKKVKKDKYVPLNCWKCKEPFLPNDQRVEVENDEGEREDCHQDCYQRLFD